VLHLLCSCTHLILPEPDWLPMSVKERRVVKESSKVLMIVLQKYINQTGQLDFIEDSLYQSLVSLCTEQLILDPLIQVKPSYSLMLRKLTSSKCGPSLNALPYVLVLSLIHLTQLEEDL